MGGKSGGSVVVGYEYYAGMHMLCCHGPVDRVTRILVGDRVAWQGTQSVTGEISINKPDLFGGRSREGGINGLVDIEIGEPSQGRNAYLVSKLGATVPAFRRLAGLVLKQPMLSALNPYIKPWKVEATRILKAEGGAAQWYSAKAAIFESATATVAYDMNPAHIVRECLTNTEWGLGYGSGDINDASFTAAADTLHTERFGLSILWDQQSKVEDFIQLILRHIEGALYVDPATGLFTLKLIRPDYITSTLPIFGADEIMEVDSFQRSTPGDSPNVVTIRWVDREGQTQATTVHDIAGLEATGQPVPVTLDMHGIPRADLALSVAMRTLSQLARPVAKMGATFTRAVSGVRIGDPIRIVSAEHGLAGQVMRVAGINYGTMRDGAIRMDLVEDVFSTPTYTFTANGGSQWQSPYTQAAEAPFRVLLEAPWWNIVREVTGESAAAQAQIDPAAGLLMVGASGTSQATINFEVWTSQGGAAYIRAGSGELTPSGILSAALNLTETSITLLSRDRLENVTVNTWAVIDAGTPNEELVLVKTLNTTTGAATIARGVLDTTPHPHSIGARVYFVDGDKFFGRTQYLDGETVQVKALTKTSLGTLALADATADSITFRRRANRPYPPGNFQINGQATPASITGDFTVTWAHRDRTLQTAYIVEQGEANIGPEAGTTYIGYVYNNATNALILLAAGITGTSWAPAVNVTNVPIRVEVEAVRGGLTSWQRQSRTFTYSSGAASVAGALLLANASIVGTAANFYSLLMHFDGANGSTSFIDSGNNGKTLTPAGNVQISTAQSQFGGASGLFDGSGDYITTANNQDFDFGAIDFTIETWVRIANTAAIKTIITTRSAAGQDSGFFFVVSAAGVLAFTFWGPTAGSAAVNISGGTLTANAWAHVAVTRSGSTFRMFLNGTEVASATSTAAMHYNSANLVNIGRDPSVVGREFNGYMDELRVIKGAAAYTSNFTPPTSPF